MFDKCGVRVRIYGLFEVCKKHLKEINENMDAKGC